MLLGVGGFFLWKHWHKVKNALPHWMGGSGGAVNPADVYYTTSAVPSADSNDMAAGFLSGGGAGYVPPKAGDEQDMASAYSAFS